MTLLNKRIQAVKVSAIRTIKQRCEELKAQGRKVFDFGIGEPDFETPEHVKQAAIEAIKAGRTRYTVTAGIPELRQALVEKFKRDNGIECSADQIIVSAAGRQPISMALECTLEEGDEVIILAPFWITYTGLVELAGGRAVIIKASAENGYKVSAEQIEKHITPRTKAMIINSPCNPTGAVYSKEELRAIGQVLKQHQILVISDEMYENYVYRGTKFCSFAAANPDMASRVLTANACSKTYAMTGWRLGYATGPTELINALIKYQGETVAHACSISQYAALGALKGPHDFVPKMVSLYEKRCSVAAEIIRQSKNLSLPHIPEGAFFMFVNISKLIGKQLAGVTISGSETFQSTVLDHTGVVVVPGKPFGDDHAFRLSIAAPDDDIRNGLEALVRFVG